jgi:hypothetical protein
MVAKNHNKSAHIGCYDNCLVFPSLSECKIMKIIQHDELQL